MFFAFGLQSSVFRLPHSSLNCLHGREFGFVKRNQDVGHLFHLDHDVIDLASPFLAFSSGRLFEHCPEALFSSRGSPLFSLRFVRP